jgi:AraC-like DNA-binding protein
VGIGASGGTSRGILHPRRAFERFSVERLAPSGEAGRFVDHLWFVHWNLPPGEEHCQRVLSHPVVNISFSDAGGRVVGPTTRLVERALAGSGWTLGIMFRPGGFWPLLKRPLFELAHRELGSEEVLGKQALRLAAVARPSSDAMVDVEHALLRMLPTAPQRSEPVTRMAELLAADTGMLRVEHLADAAGCSVRHLQRQFRAYVGLSPKDVIRRYRLQEVAERARSEQVDWPRVAAELGYSDQSHLIREFTTIVGEPPARYARDGTR